MAPGPANDGPPGAAVAGPPASNGNGRVPRGRSSSCLSSAGRSAIKVPAGAQAAGGQRGSLPSNTLTPSMARIAERDCVVELNGMARPPPFEVGGRHGNIVTLSRALTVHKGWRVVAVDGKPLQPPEVRVALAGANARGRYTVTFRIGDRAETPADEEERPTSSNADTAEAELRKAEAEAEDERKRQVLAAAEAEREAEAEAKRRREEEQRGEKQREADMSSQAEAAKAEAKRRAELAASEQERTRAEEEALRQRRRREDEEAAKELRRKEKEDDERKTRESQVVSERVASEKLADAQRQKKLQAQRDDVEKRLTASAGLPPRRSVSEPQQVLLEVLAAPTEEKTKTGPCDKCDGPHHADDCPHFKGKKREKHTDAWDKYGVPGGAKDPKKDIAQVILRNARIVSQPGDGSCLFHSLAYGLGSTNASALRASIADYMTGHPDQVISGNPIKDWVLWDSGLDVSSYASSMRAGSRWGGAVEIAVCAQVHGARVHVYERGPSGFKRISAFEPPGAPATARVVSVHYGGRVHYDALEVAAAK